MNQLPAEPDARPPQGPELAATPSEDPFAYRLAVCAIGVALVAFLIGATVIAADGKPVPTQFWTAGSGLAGALIGILAPTPKPGEPTPRKNKATRFLGGIADAIRDLWINRAVLILLAVFGVSLGFAIAHNSSQLESIAAAAGGALVGLLAPPPGGAQQANRT